MSRSWGSDAAGVLRGIQMILNTSVKHQTESLKVVMDNLSLKAATEEKLKSGVEQLNSIRQGKDYEKSSIQGKELVNKVLIVEEGLVKYIKSITNEFLNFTPFSQCQNHHSQQITVHNSTTAPKESSNYASEDLKKEPDKNVVKVSRKYNSVKEKIEKIGKVEKTIPKIELTDREKKLLRRLEIEHETNIKSTEKQVPPDSVEFEVKTEATKTAETPRVTAGTTEEDTRMKPVIKPKQTLSASAKERKVPSTRIQRMISFGTLGIGLGIGTIAEYGRRTLGIKHTSIGESLDNAFLTKANAERIVSTLCKVRGAALKIGQILSIQDNNIISPDIQKAFERVRQSADFMPTWQVQKVLAEQLGSDWRSKIDTFEEKPFAAASIGQVHVATLTNTQAPVAMKIQYPGVAEGIQSDIDNLVGVLKIWNMFPDGMFIDNVVEVAKRELAWEVDYVREAECSKKFKELLLPYPEYHVPAVIDDLSAQRVFTTELIEGVSVEKCAEMDMAVREYICLLIMELCLKELFVFRFMQTDPNWANFFYNSETKQLILLDFGACRSYEKSFMDDYIEIIYAAGKGDRNKVLQLSRKMKFLTGYESKVMENAHVDAVMILGEVFSEKNEKYDFGGQNVTKSMQKLVPTIISHRLCPPPEEIYSLHRKLSGVFLLCAKLKVKINCRELFQRVYDNYT